MCGWIGTFDVSFYWWNVWSPRGDNQWIPNNSLPLARIYFSFRECMFEICSFFFSHLISQWDWCNYKNLTFSGFGEKAIADVEKSIFEALEKHFNDVLSPLKDNLTNRIFGHKYVQRLSKGAVDIYLVPDEVYFWILIAPYFFVLKMVVMF